MIRASPVIKDESMTAAPRPSSKQSQFMPFKPSWLNRLRSPLQSAGYYVLLSRSAQAFMDRLSPYQKMALSQKLYSLAGNPRSDKARHMKNTTDKYYIPEENTGFSITYEILSGKVYVTSIVPDLNATGIHKEVPALYHVEESQTGVTFKKIRYEDIKTASGAVNGQSNIRSIAVNLMLKHVKHAFGENLSEYTLFHNPSDGGIWDSYESSLDKRGYTTGVAKEFAKALQGVQNAGKPVNWVAHSQGGIIFTQAVKYHLDQGGPSLDKNGVKFHASANNNKQSDTILGQAKIKIYGYNNHPFDFVPKLGGNDITTGKIIGSITHFPYVVRGSENRSPHTLPYNGMENYIKNMPGWYKVLYKLFS